MYLRRRCIFFMNSMYRAKCIRCNKITSFNNLISADPRNSHDTMFGPQTLRKKIPCLDKSDIMKEIEQKYYEEYKK